LPVTAGFPHLLVPGRIGAMTGTVEPDTSLFDELVAAMPEAQVHAAGDCSGLGLIRKATEDGARAACSI
jgi:2,4-dienoyl-CoA reductase (NADPH2)